MCVHLCRYICPCEQACKSEGNARMSSSIVSTLFLEIESLINPRNTNSARRAGQWTPEIFISPPSVLGLQVCTSMLTFMWLLGIQTKVQYLHFIQWISFPALYLVPLTTAVCCLNLTESMGVHQPEHHQSFSQTITASSDSQKRFLSSLSVFVLSSVTVYSLLGCFWTLISLLK